MYDKNNMLTRAGMEQVIREGGTVQHKGKLYSRIESLPSEADLAAGDEDAERRALAGLEEQQRALDAQRDRLSRAAADRAKAAKQREAQQAALDAAEHKEGDTYGDNNLSLDQLSGMSDEDVLNQPGIGEATLAKIRKAQKKAAAKK
jgi:hypothetical protein